MKIGQLSEEKKSEVVSTASARKAKPQEGEAPAGVAAGGTAAEASAQVAISSSALASEGGDAADFDHAKVDRIATAIREGRFTVNAEAIADKLITNAQELLGRSH